MTLSTQTWRVSAKYNVASASASTVTQLEMITAFKAMFDAEDIIGGSSWSYVASDLSAGYIILKRKGSPTGTLATYRAIIFGNAGTTAAAANVLLGTPTTAGYLYVASTEDGANNTIANAWGTGAALTGKYVPGSSILAGAFGAGTSSSVKCFMVDSDEVCYIFVTTSTSSNLGFMIGVGAIGEKYDGTAIWGNITTRGSSTGADTGQEQDTASAIAVAVISGNATSYPSGGYYDISTTRGLGRVNSANFSAAAAPDTLQDTTNSYAALMPIILGSKSVTTGPVNYAGILRQARVGPRNVGQLGLKNSGGTVVAYMLNAGYNALGHGLILDTVA